MPAGVCPTTGPAPSPGSVAQRCRGLASLGACRGPPDVQATAHKGRNGLRIVPKGEDSLETERDGRLRPGRGMMPCAIVFISHAQKTRVKIADPVSYVHAIFVLGDEKRGKESEAMGAAPPRMADVTPGKVSKGCLAATEHYKRRPASGAPTPFNDTN